MVEHVSLAQKQALTELVDQNRDVFSSEAGHTDLVQHHIITEPGKGVKLRPYRIPEARRDAVSRYNRRVSPIVLVPKPDSTIRFCNYFRKLNEIPKFDAYACPMPQIDELIEQLRTARFISMLDLTKGYWQVPLTPEAREKTAFATPDRLLHYRMLPFGLHRALSTFQRLMRRVLRPHCGCGGIPGLYSHPRMQVGDPSNSGERSIAGLTEGGNTAANPRKCRLGLQEADYWSIPSGGDVPNPR